MANQKSAITTHIKKIVQDNPEIITLGLTEAQILELMSTLTVALREGARHKDGMFHLAVWKIKKVANCQAKPPCGGGMGSIQLVRPRESE